MNSSGGHRLLALGQRIRFVRLRVFCFDSSRRFAVAKPIKCILPLRRADGGGSSINFQLDGRIEAANLCIASSPRDGLQYHRFSTLFPFTKKEICMNNVCKFHLNNRWKHAFSARRSQFSCSEVRPDNGPFTGKTSFGFIFIGNFLDC